MKQIEGFKGYFIDQYGNVFSEKKGKYKVPFLSKNGYMMVSLTKDGKQKNYTVHSLVIKTFVGEKPTEKHQCMHIDGNKLNNLFTNLKWGTVRENHLDKKNHGTFQEGESHGMHKLTKEQVLQIKNSNMPHVYWAKQFNVTPEAIAYAKNIGWRSLESSARAEGRSTT